MCLFTCNTIVMSNSKNDKTIFEKIINREIPAEIWYEDDLVTVFFDINPVTFGHSLVISKSPHPWIQDVPPAELGQIFEKIPSLINKLKSTTKSNYVQLAVMGLDVPHFHIHLIPRKFGDNHNELYPNEEAKQKDRSELLRSLQVKN